ncbi:MAG: transcriptional repressor [Fibrobacterota bacterium]
MSFHNSENKNYCKYCIDFLSEQNENLSGKETNIIECFFGTEKHISIDELVKECGCSNATDQKSVRRIMKLLVKYGFAAEKKFDGKPTLYEHLHPHSHHDHITCAGCGKIIEFFSPEMEDFQKRLAREKGFHLLSHKMVLSGFCSDCREKLSKKSIPLSEAGAGCAFRVENFIQSGHGHKNRFGCRLSDMGLHPGMKGRVLANAFGKTVVSAGETRIALGRGMAKKVMVKILEKDL